MINQLENKIIVKKWRIITTAEEKNNRGHGRIRTAVEGFADPCLTTRPHDLLIVDGIKLISSI